MNEIVVVHVGGGGIRLGLRFWEAVCSEHGIDPTGVYKGDTFLQLERIEVFFDEASGGRHLPRAIFADLDPATRAEIESSPVAPLFEPDNLIFGKAEAKRSWDEGHNGTGLELVDQVMDAVRKAAENAEGLQGFIVFHTLGGGTGSGMGTLLVSRIKEEYPDRSMATFSVFPSLTEITGALEQGNAALGVEQLIEHADMVFCLDNAALDHRCRLTMPPGQAKEPTVHDLNRLIQPILTGVTATLRQTLNEPRTFGGTLAEMARNLVPFPRLHFLTVGAAPIQDRASGPAAIVADLTYEMFHQTGRYLAASALVRAPVSRGDVDQRMRAVRSKNAHRFVDWIPHSLRANVCEPLRHGSVLSASFIGNSTSARGLLLNIIKRSKAGTGASDLSGAELAVSALCDEYPQYEYE